MKSVLLENGYSSEVFKINNNGTVETILTGELDTICDVKPKSFPFDCQSCYVIMGPPTVSGTYEVPVWHNASPVLDLEAVRDQHPFWRVEQVTTSASASQFGSAFAILNIKLKRLPHIYVYTLVLPASSLSVLAVSTFFIPIYQGERVSFCVTIFLSYMVLMLQVSEMLPEDSRDLPDIGKVYFMTLSRVKINKCYGLSNLQAHFSYFMVVNVIGIKLPIVDRNLLYIGK